MQNGSDIITVVDEEHIILFQSPSFERVLGYPVEAALGIEAPPRAASLRALMAELERVANHLGDFGAICNDASFALIQAHCAVLREKVLRAPTEVIDFVRKFVEEARK